LHTLPLSGVQAKDCLITAPKLSNAKSRVSIILILPHFSRTHSKHPSGVLAVRLLTTSCRAKAAPLMPALHVLAVSVVCHRDDMTANHFLCLQRTSSQHLGGLPPSESGKGAVVGMVLGGGPNDYM